MLADYHDRATIVLERDDWSTWLSPEADTAVHFEVGRAERFEVSKAT